VACHDEAIPSNRPFAFSTLQLSSSAIALATADQLFNLSTPSAFFFYIPPNTLSRGETILFPLLDLFDFLLKNTSFHPVTIFPGYLFFPTFV
jgi:hypothetical protein